MNVMLSQFYADIHLQTIAWLNYEQCQQCSQISGLGENCSYRNEHGHRSNVNLSEIMRCFCNFQHRKLQQTSTPRS